MNNPLEKPSVPETNLTPADTEPAGAAIPADFAKRLEEFEKETRRRKTYVKWWTIIAVAGATLIPLLLLLFPRGEYAAMGLIFGMVMLLMGCCGRASINNPGSIRKPSEETLALTNQCGGQAIGPLVDRIVFGAAHQECELIWQAILEQLKRTSLEEAEALTPVVRAALNQRLSDLQYAGKYTLEQIEFCLIWIRFLKDIGDKRDFLKINLVAQSDAPTQFQKTIRVAARQCLSHIKANIKAQEPGKTLLRASHSPPTAPETLLRPAAKSNPTAPKELLRPVEPEETREIRDRLREAAGE